MTIQDIASKTIQRQGAVLDGDSLRREYLAEIYAYAARRLALREDAEDATAETFAAALAHLHRIKPEEARLWLFGIARRKVADVARRRSRRREVPLSESVYVEAPSAELEESRERLRKLVSELPEDQREAIVLHYLENLSHQDVAVVMRKSVKAVNSLLQRARARLYRQGSPFYEDPSDTPKESS